MRTSRSFDVLLATALCLFAAPGCGGGGGGGDAAVSLFAAGVTAQDLVAEPYVDAVTNVAYLVLGDVLGRGQVVVPGFVSDSSGAIDQLRWSPDHSLLAVAALPTGAVDVVLFVLEPLTGEVTQVSGLQPAGTFVQDFAWAPDSRRLAFSRNGSPGTPLSTVNADGSNRVEVSGPIVAGGDVNEYVWSPDSSRLAFVADADTDGTQEIFVVARNGSGRVKASGPGAGAGCSAFRLDWSPDSTRVAYVGNLDDAAHDELFVSLASGAGGRTKVNPTPVSGGSVNRFAWAPDGSRLAYVVDQTTDDVVELFTSLPNGTGVVRVSGAMVVGGDIEPGAFRWAPNSSRIAYVADQTTNDVFELFTVVPDASAAAVRVSGPMVAGGDLGGQFGNRLDAFAWSPDSSRIAYKADQEVDGKEEVYVTLPASASPTRVSASVVATGRVLDGPAWSDDSLHVTFIAEHLTVIADLFVSPRGGPAVVVASSAAGVIPGYADDDPLHAFAFGRALMVATLRPTPVGDGEEIRAFDATTLSESVVIVPPTPSFFRSAAVR